MSDIVVGQSELSELLTEITPKEVSSAIRKGMRAGLKKQMKAAQLALRASVSGATRPSKLYSDTLVDAIRMRVGDGEWIGDTIGVLHTMGSNKKGSGTFRARFFEGGTVDRWQKTWKGKPLKKKRYLGKIQPTKFFSSSTAGTEQLVSNEIQAALEKTIQRLNAI